MGQGYVKDPDAVLDYTFDWQFYLDGDTISTSTWVVPSGLTKDSESNTTTSATVWLSGGTVGNTYFVTNRITTVGGRTEDRSLSIQCEEQ